MGTALQLITGPLGALEDEAIPHLEELMRSRDPLLASKAVCAVEELAESEDEATRRLSQETLRRLTE